MSPALMLFLAYVNAICAVWNWRDGREGLAAIGGATALILILKLAVS